MARKKKKLKKLMEKSVREHFYLGPELYHWDILPSGKRSSHKGLGKGCPLFAGLLPKEYR